MSDCSFRVLEMCDCSIRVTALLEYFEWTQVNNTAGQKAKGTVFCVFFLTMLAIWVNF